MTAIPALAIQPAPTRPYAWWVVFVLSLGSIASAFDRQIINLLVEPIKADLAITDTQVSLLQGFAFAIFYAALAIPLGRWADRGNRRNVVLAGCLLWTAATFGCGMAVGFYWLFAGRMAVGVGEASLTPAAYSMISDYFPPERIARPISAFTGSGFIGSGIALIGGGAVLAALQAYGPVTVPGVGALADWKAAFVIVSLPGLLVALLLWLTVREPRRSEAFTAVRAEEGPAKSELLAFLRQRARVIAPLFLGLSLLAASQFAIGAWTPSFFIRTFGWSAARIGVAYGLLVALGGALGVVAGGWLSDRMKARGVVDANLRVPILAALAAAPLAIAFPLVSSPEAAIALLLPLAVLGPMPFGAGTAAIPALAPNRLRAQLVALYLLVANIVGVGAGPWLVARVTDGVLGDPSQLRYSLALVAPTLMVAGAGLIWLATGAFRRLVQNPPVDRGGQSPPGLAG